MNKTREAGKGSKPRPFSVSREKYSNNWDKIFSKNKPKKPGLYKNTIDQEVWLCDNFTQTNWIDNAEYVSVYKEDAPNRKLLMKKDVLQRVDSK